MFSQGRLSQRESLAAIWAKADSIKRAETVAWGLLLVFTGAVLLAPEGLLPEGTWSLGVGALLLGSSGVRILAGFKPDGFVLFLGALALAFGLSGVLGLGLPWYSILLVVTGSGLLLATVLRPSLEDEADMLEMMEWCA